MRRLITAATALAAVVAFACFLLFLPAPKHPYQHPRPCTLMVVPHTFQCADGHVYIAHPGHWQDIGPAYPPPPIPKA